MSNKRVSVPVVLEFGQSISQFMEVFRTAHNIQGKGPTRELTDRLASGLSALIEELGLPGKPSVKLVTAQSPLLFGIRINGELVRYSPVLLKRLWMAILPPESFIDFVALSKVKNYGGNDQYIEGFFSYLQASNRSSDWRTVSDLLYELVMSAIWTRPACLVSQEQADVYLAKGLSRLGEPVPPGLQRHETATILKQFLRSLINLGVSVKDQNYILKLLASRDENSVSPKDIIEEAFAYLHSNRIEIRINRLDLAIFHLQAPKEGLHSVYAEGISQPMIDSFRFLEEGMFEELGVRLPDIVWLPSDEIPSGCFRFKINDHIGPPVAGLKPGELLVNDTPEHIENRNIRARPAFNPSSNFLNSIVLSEHKTELEEAGFTTWDATGVLILAMANEIRFLAHRLVSYAEVEYLFAVVEQSFPALALATLARFSLEDISRLLRRMVYEGLSIRNLKAVLERLAQFDTISTETESVVVLDDRIPLSQSVLNETIYQWLNFVQFVRNGFKSAIAHKYTRGSGTLVGYLLDPQIESSLLSYGVLSCDENGNPLIDEHLVDHILQSIWAELSYLPETASLPSILTLQGARLALKGIIVGEIPQMAVVSYQELPPDLNIQPVARIKLSQ